MLCNAHAMEIQNVHSRGLLEVADVAELLEVSTYTVRRWADQGKIRHIRLPGGRFKFFHEDIDALLTPIEPHEPVGSAR